ncbi:MAG: AAA family ATPase [Candidatus Bathyarchaeota archaeon]|nr:MAG: AAA family ATPase [Candidatus Bathyarchaeota archaeon]
MSRRAKALFIKLNGKSQMKGHAMYVIAVCCTLLLTNTSVQAMEQSRQLRTPPIEISAVLPESATPGSLIKITFRRDTTLDASEVKVQFDDIVVNPEDVTSEYILVRIPEQLPSNRNPKVVVFSGQEQSAPYFGLTIKSLGPSLPSVTKVILAIALIIGIIVIGASLSGRFRPYFDRLLRIWFKTVDDIIKMQKRVSKKKYDIDVEAATPLQLSQPEPPDDLIQAIEAGESALFAGAGLSARAKFPTWRPFIGNLVQWAIENKFIDENYGQSLHSAIAEDAIDSVADGIIDALKTDNHEKALNKYLRQIFVEPLPRLPHSHRLLSKIGFSAALTTNFDNLLEKTFDDVNAKVYTPQDTEPLLNALTKRDFFLLKLYGSLEQPESVLITPAQYEQFVAGNRPLSQFMGNLFYLRTILFIGASLDGIEDYLGGLQFQGYVSRNHYALVSVAGSAWRAKADLLKRRYGIEVLPYVADQEHGQVDVFLETLVKRLGRRDVAGGAISTGDLAERKQKASSLKRVKLENIGPFDSLELELNSHWNILLGDNGVGKSTILRAIALGICGKDAQPYADRLIKTRKTSAKITLETTNRKRYLTEIHRTSGETEIKSIPVRLLEAEGWLVLGFPPIRALSWKRPEGSEPMGEKGRPTPSDLLPLIKGEPDPRLDKLKQWIVNLDHRIKDEKSRKQADNRYEMLLKDFWQVVDHLTEGLRVEFKKVDLDTYEITIITDDGPVPMEAISQGTTSLIGWIGITLQRLYEIYGYEGRPKERFSLVLMDEIDAHMHPEWQQKLVFNLKKLLPNVQFIATTHSPLIVGGMRKDQVVRLARNESGIVQKVEIPADMLLGRADQILTGDLFGLASTLSLGEEGEKLMAEYEKLLGISKKTKEQELRYRKLHSALESLLPPASSETKLERRTQELVNAILTADYSPKKVNLLKRELLEKTRKVAQSMGWKELQ